VRVGDLVCVAAQWSSFYGMKGKVTAIAPHLMILIHGDKYPIRVGEREVVVEEPSELNLTGAE
jgi:hypothetical protein